MIWYKKENINYFQTNVFLRLHLQSRSNSVTLCRTQFGLCIMIESWVSSLQCELRTLGVCSILDLYICYCPVTKKYGKHLLSFSTFLWNYAENSFRRVSWNRLDFDLHKAFLVFGVILYEIPKYQLSRFEDYAIPFKTLIRWILLRFFFSVKFDTLYLTLHQDRKTGTNV